MSRRSAGAGLTASRSFAVAGVGAVLVLVAVLVVAAYQHARPAVSPGAAAPVPTFTFGERTPTPTPTPTQAPDAAAPSARETDRFLAAGTGAGASTWRRAIAGACGGAAPVLERSVDGGATWASATPPGAAQIAALDSFNQTEAEIVTAGSTCDVQGLRTYTQGGFWEPFADVLATSRYIAPADSGTVITPAGSIAAPCAEARGLRARGSVVALICDGIAYAADANGGWTALPGADAAAVAIDGGGVLVASAGAECEGLTLTLFAAGDPAQPGPSRCAAVSAAQPIAIASSEVGTLVWAGDVVTVVP